MRIENNDALASEAKALGLRRRRRFEPKAKNVAVKYSYDAGTGEIIGPRGKALKLATNRDGGLRLGVWRKGKTRKIRAERVAFVCQHGRWPVAVAFRNGDKTDLRAENLFEVQSRDMRLVKEGKRQILGTELIVAQQRSVQLFPLECFEFRPDPRIERTLAALSLPGLSLRDRLNLEHWLATFRRKDRLKKAKAGAELMFLKGKIASSDVPSDGDGIRPMRRKPRRAFRSIDAAAKAFWARRFARRGAVSARKKAVSAR